MPVLGDNVGDAFEVRLDGVAEVVGVVVAGRRAHGVEVDLQRDGFRADRHEPVLPDEIEQRHLVGDVLVVASEVLFIAAIGRRGDAEHEGVLIEMPQCAEVAVGERVVRFVHDDEAEVIARPAVAPSRAHQRLHAGDDDRRIQARALVRHLDLGGEAGDGADFVHGLHDEFLAVGNHERPARLMDGREMREHDGFSTTGREHEQLALILREAALDRLGGRDLVAPQRDVRMGCCHRSWAWGWRW